MLQVFLWTMRIHGLWQNTCQITTARWVWTLWKQWYLPLKASVSSGDVPALQSSMEFCTANMNCKSADPSYSCYKQALHENRPGTTHVFTILNEILSHLSSWPFLWYLKWENTCMCKVIKFTFGNGTWTQHTAPRLRPEGISTVQRWNMWRQKYEEHGDVANCEKRWALLDW